MKLGYFAPMPPAATGVAQYAAALLGQLEKRFEIVSDSDANPMCRWRLQPSAWVKTPERFPSVFDSASRA